MVYQDRTRRALSNGHLFGSIWCLDPPQNGKFWWKSGFLRYFATGFAYRLDQKEKMVYQDRTRRALSNGHLSGSIRCMDPLRKGKSWSKSRFLWYFATGFAYRLDQKEKMVYQDRTRCALSNGHLSGSIRCLDPLRKGKSWSQSEFLRCISQLDSPIG